MSTTRSRAGRLQASRRRRGAREHVSTPGPNVLVCLSTHHSLVRASEEWRCRERERRTRFRCWVSTDKPRRTLAEVIEQSRRRRTPSHTVCVQYIPTSRALRAITSLLRVAALLLSYDGCMYVSRLRTSGPSRGTLLCERKRQDVNMMISSVSLTAHMAKVNIMNEKIIIFRETNLKNHFKLYK